MAFKENAKVNDFAQVGIVTKKKIRECENCHKIRACRLRAETVLIREMWLCDDCMIKVDG
jgi:hypothetical protein